MAKTKETPIQQKFTLLASKARTLAGELNEFAEMLDFHKEDVSKTYDENEGERATPEIVEPKAAKEPPKPVDPVSLFSKADKAAWEQYLKMKDANNIMGMKYVLRNRLTNGTKDQKVKDYCQPLLDALDKLAPAPIQANTQEVKEEPATE